MKSGLGPRLEQLYQAYNREDAAADPIQIVRRYALPADQEVVGFCAAALAFGRVASVLNTVETLTRVLGPAPAAYVRRFDPAAPHPELRGMVHRWTRGVDIVALLWILRQMLDRSGSIERFFVEGDDPAAPDIGQSLDSFSRRALAVDLEAVYGRRVPARTGVCYFFPRPSAGSGCKRLNLFLRWMIRRDEVDLGAWMSIPRSRLIVPLDTHVIRLGRCLRLTRYTSPGWPMAAEITASLRAIDPVDPVRFDFSICHVGMMNACGFGRRQGDSQCPLKGICRPRARGGAGIAALIVVFVAAAVAFAGGWFLGARRTVMAVPSPGGGAVAYVFEARCAAGLCQSLWIGKDMKQATMAETLSGSSEQASEIAWTPDGGRVAFIVNGYQLRLFDGRTAANLGAMSLIDPDGFPSSRIARGVTFSVNGAAVTFDDCPRYHSGCKPALLAIKR